MYLYRQTFNAARLVRESLLICLLSFNINAVKQVKLRILILGCGWIGEALADRLMLEGHEVYATTTNLEKYQRLQAAGIFAIMANFDEPVDQSDFPSHIDFVLNSIPAVKRLDYPLLTARFEAARTLLKQLAYRKHIFLSSVGVYPDRDGEFTEETILDERDNKLLAAEVCMQALPNTIVYRLGGLFGGQRIFAKYFQDKVCTTGAQCTNFVHQTDVLNLIQLGFQKQLSASCYNLVTPESSSKREAILASAAKYGFRPPAAFDDQECFQKHVSGDKIRQALDYTFVYPSPLDF